MPKGKRVTEEEFDLMKTLQEANVRASATATATKRSGATVRKVYKCEDFEEYKTPAKPTNGVENESETDRLSAVDMYNTEIAILKAIEYQLQEINSTLKGAVTE